MEGDRKIPALKLFISQLDRARQPAVAADMLGVDTNLVGLVLLGVDFTRVWLQVRPTNLGPTAVAPITCSPAYIKGYPLGITAVVLSSMIR